jgi:hypothetical protein
MYSQAQTRSREHAVAAQNLTFQISANDLKSLLQEAIEIGKRGTDTSYTALGMIAHAVLDGRAERARL